MFGNRPDGRQIKTIDPIFKLIPHIMTHRSDAQLFYKVRVYTDVLDEYIRAHREEYPGLSYMAIVIAAFVRLLALRPSLNRFVVNGRLFARRSFWVSFNLKRILLDDCVETCVKLPLNGTEDLGEINRQINQQIELCRVPQEENLTDKAAAMFTALPNLLVQISVGFLKFLDRIGCMPRWALEASPFHTSFYFTNVKSLKLNYLYHHAYNFGTTSLFVAMGNSEDTVTFDHTGPHCRKSITLGVTIDERICDGLYLANSLTLFKHLMRDPSALAVPLEAITEDIP
mgnify:CR=1 FL=1